jgi:hypothetical protein
MLERLHERRVPQLLFGFLFGVVFGFLLHKGGVTDYDVILGQLLLRDFTVLKIMLSAVVVGMLGIQALRSMKLARLHPKPGSPGSTVIGGLVFGLGFATLGYCPGTLAGAVGSGRLDALVAGVPGILVGAWLFAVLYPRLQKPVLAPGDFGELTLPGLLRVNAWLVVVPLALAIAGFLWWLERVAP